MIGNFRVAFYGVTMALGMILGSMLILHEAKRTGQSDEDYLDIIIWCLISAVVGARAYYVIFAWDYYKDDLLSIFNIRGGGMGIIGGLIGAFITGYFVCRHKKMSFVLACDTCIIGVPVGQIIGRFGNFFNREAYGQYTDGLFAMQIPLDRCTRASSVVTDEMMNHLVEYDGLKFISVHPTFLYEALWNLGLLILLLWMRKHTRFRGQMVLTYIIGYGLGRFWIESLRIDQLIFFGTGIPVTMIVSAIMVLGGILLMVYARKKEIDPAEGMKAVEAEKDDEPEK
ncbi:MAG: prolipoprotein diacylglyceryl transferase [Lachnospiraceae bacterium]|nr:prolipoprotein diacylglyceryl transferase [Lachnospiraceae bacterium]